LQNQTFGNLLAYSGTCCYPLGCQLTFTPPCSGNGVFMGIGSQCELCKGACCLSNGTCSVMLFSACASSGGMFRGYGSACPGTCLVGDTDNDNHVDVDDLLTVITRWGACPPPCPPCPGD